MLGLAFELYGFFSVVTIVLALCLLQGSKGTIGSVPESDSEDRN